MKTMRKVLSVLLVLAMVLSLGAMAVSAGEPTGSITVTDPEDGQTYTLYKVFDLTYSPTDDPKKPNAAYTYTAKDVTPENDAFLQRLLNAKRPDGNQADDVASPFDLAYSGMDGNKQVYNVTLKEAYQGPDKVEEARKAVTDFLNKYKEMLPQQASKRYPDDAVEGAKTLVFDGVPTGYYYLTSTLGTLVTISSNTPDVDVQEKNTAPAVDKEVGGDGSAAVGDVIPFRITIKAQEGAKGYVLTDVMSKGLTSQKNVKVYKDNQSQDELPNDGNVNYSVAYTDGNETEGDKFVLTFTEQYLNSIKGEVTLYVVYSAVLNADAITVDEVNNTAKLEYGDNSETSVTPDKTTTTHTYGFDVVKTDAQNNLLDGAVFALYSQAQGGNPTPLFYDTAKKCYRFPVGQTEVDAATTELVASKGVLRIDGLAEGTYYLEETKAPEGYNKLTDRKEVKIEDTDNNGVNDKGKLDMEFNPEGTQWVEGGVQVINQAGSLLPSTGGMGTTMFYVLGAVLVLGAAILLVAKRRVREQ